NVLQNLAEIEVGAPLGRDARIVSWLPQYHDLGLFCGYLAPVYAGTAAALMSPIDFLKDPIGWLEAISALRATTSFAPNFAAALCLRQGVRDRRLDLRAFRAAFIGAEPIWPRTIERFAEAFAPFGFRLEAFAPAYGLAESCCAVSARTGATSLAIVEHAE